MINLNRVDPNIVKIVVERTAKTTVHKKEDPYVDKDGKHRQQNQERLEEIRKKIKFINRLFKESEVEMYLTLRKYDIGAIIEVLVLDRGTDQILAVVDEEGLERIMLEIHSQIGIILDKKG